jgi:hypothetical protein
MGPFTLVVTSPIPRAVETSIAMGFEVHQTLGALGNLPGGVLNGLGWPSPFAGVTWAVTKGLRCSEFAEVQAGLWRSIGERVPDSEQALVVTHGAFVELGTVEGTPEAGFDTWGDAIGYCEGVRLSYDGAFTACERLHVPEEYHLIEN